MPKVKCYREEELTDSQVAAIVKLTNSVWPKEGLTLETRVKQMQDLVRSAVRASIRPRRFVVWDEETAIAHALVFDRTVYALDEKDQRSSSIDVLALAGVCTDAGRRGEGLGLAIVETAFQELDANRPVSLFQTGVPEFYEKLGGRVIHNPFCNLLNDDDPQSNPWWDMAVMILPGESINRQWPEEKIDMNGAGY